MEELKADRLVVHPGLIASIVNGLTAAGGALGILLATEPGNRDLRRGFE